MSLANNSLFKKLSQQTADISDESDDEDNWGPELEPGKIEPTIKDFNSGKDERMETKKADLFDDSDEDIFKDTKTVITQVKNDR